MLRVLTRLYKRERTEELLNDVKSSLSNTCEYIENEEHIAFRNYKISKDSQGTVKKESHTYLCLWNFKTKVISTIYQYAMMYMNALRSITDLMQMNHLKVQGTMVNCMHILNDSNCKNYCHMNISTFLSMGKQQ